MAGPSWRGWPRVPSVALLWADGGYANKVDTSLLAWAKDKLHLLVEIVKRSDDVKGFQVLPRRWVVERTFGWLVRNRRLARDYERLTDTSETMSRVARGNFTPGLPQNGA